MGSASSRLIHPSCPAASCEELFSREEYQVQAQNILSRLQIIPPLRRRRARSVGLSEKNDTFWVYWRPGRNENGRPQDVQPCQGDEVEAKCNWDVLNWFERCHLYLLICTTSLVCSNRYTNYSQHFWWPLACLQQGRNEVNIIFLVVATRPITWISV